MALITWIYISHIPMFSASHTKKIMAATQSWFYKDEFLEVRNNENQTIFILEQVRLLLLQSTAKTLFAGISAIAEAPHVDGVTLPTEDTMVASNIFR